MSTVFLKKKGKISHVSVIEKHVSSGILGTKFLNLFCILISEQIKYFLSMKAWLRLYDFRLELGMLCCTDYSEGASVKWAIFSSFCTRTF